jgi:hypothetical protein
LDIEEILPTEEEIVYAFAMEENLSRDLLAAYCRKYPKAAHRMKRFFLMVEKERFESEPTQ